MKHSIEISLDDIPTETLIKEILSRKTENVYTACTDIDAIKIEINLKHADEFLIIHNKYRKLINNHYTAECERSELLSFGEQHTFGFAHKAPLGCICNVCREEAIREGRR
jgi:hypothetical protein